MTYQGRYIAHLEDYVTAGELLEISQTVRVDKNRGTENILLFPKGNSLLSPSSVPYTQVLIQTPLCQRQIWVYGEVPETFVGSQVRLTESLYDMDNGKVLNVQRFESIEPKAQEIFNQAVLEQRN